MDSLDGGTFGSMLGHYISESWHNDKQYMTPIKTFGNLSLMHM
jgi:hypothetical protein